MFAAIMTTIHFIRHAESQGNVNHHLIGGQSNHYLLTERGESQARLLGERLHREGYQFDQVFASTAVRARETARIACGFLGLDLTTIDYSPQLLELSQGEWEGKSRADIYTPEKKAEVWGNPLHFKAPGGESQQEVADRMRAWLDGALAGLDHKQDQVIAAFSHGFAIKTLISRILLADPAFTYRMVTHNTSITTLQFTGRQFLLERFNDFQHLHSTDFIGHYG
ncbi:MAG: histidine phosphatase family protein [Bacteroidota bacterium]